MKSLIFYFSYTLLIVLCLFYPVFFIGVIFGLGGSTSKYYLMMAVGYNLAIIFSVITLYSNKFMLGIVFSTLIFLFGVYLDNQFWVKDNAGFCDELRGNPSCIESETGFYCDDFDGNETGLSIGIEICNNL